MRQITNKEMDTMTRLIIANPEATAKATVTPVDIVLMSLDTRIESAQEDFLFHARWAARDLERVIRDAEAGTPSEFHGESSIAKMNQAALTVRLLAEARQSVLWSCRQWMRDAAKVRRDKAREGE